MQNKPNWEDAPEWANYLAQDYCGQWWWYENMPRIYCIDRTESAFVWKVGHTDDRIESVEPLVKYRSNSQWEETLEERPSN